MIPRDTNFGAKQEMSSNGDEYNTSKASSSSTTTTTTTASWSRLKDPRIVRVSRAVGGKDRHSKVCTVRGLRDRRVRLSVQTAIQLYDLQERLGLNQPSKVVDWLLDAAKHEINELPPLQIPQGSSFTQILASHHSVGETSERNKQSWTRNEDQAANYSSFSTAMGPYSSSYGRWDPSNLTLSQTPTSLALIAHQDQELHNFSVVYQSAGMIAQPYFMPPSNAAFGAKQPSFHSSDLSSSSLTAARPFNFNMTADLLPSQHEAVNEQTKRN